MTFAAQAIWAGPTRTTRDKIRDKAGLRRPRDHGVHRGLPGSQGLNTAQEPPNLRIVTSSISGGGDEVRSRGIRAQINVRTIASHHAAQHDATLMGHHKREIATTEPAGGRWEEGGLSKMATDGGRKEVEVPQAHRSRGGGEG